MLYLRDKRGLGLVESLMSLVLLSMLLISILAAFFISRLGTLRAKHRMVAMSKVREYMEQEIRAGFLGGYVDGDYYVTVSSASIVSITIDDNNTPLDSSDDLTGTIKPSPYPGSITTIGTTSYKTIGFIAEWNDKVFGTGPAPSMREQAITYVSEHS